MNKIIVFIIAIMSIVRHDVSAQNTQSSYSFDRNMVEGVDYMPKRIIFKVKPEYRDYCFLNKIDVGVLNTLLDKIQPKSVEKKFPIHKAPTLKNSPKGYALTDLSLIYEIEYTASTGIEKAMNLLMSSGQLEYAVPHVLPKLLYTPNDPMIGSQWALGKIKAYQAWDIAKGDTNVIIGISDTGIDIDHPDLINSIKYNYYDPIDLIDNDNDGFVDNYRGWDFGEDDNNPQINTSRHGVWVGGICAATSDNGIGMTGTAFKCKIMPLRIDNATGILVGSYESIVYGSDHGCNIINCSWGGAGSSGQYGQDIINYATLNNNTLIVAAAGNNGQETFYYPASYNYVLSVAGTNSSDIRWWGNETTASSYNNKVDISAPAQSIYATDDGGVYATTWGGTSFAAPLVSGAAGLVKSKYPSMTAIQIGELLKVTSDKIDSLTSNLPYYGKLGAGRLNMYRAVTELNKPSVVVNNVDVVDNNNQIFLSGDTLNITAYVTNYLAPTSNMLAILSSPSSYASIINGLSSYGIIQMMQQKSNALEPFKVLINNTVLIDRKIDFTLTLQDGIYSTTYDFTVKFNLDYIEINENKIHTTLSSDGKIAWVDADRSHGQGFIYDGSSPLAGNIGLMIGSSATLVSDATYGNSGFSSFENDFKVVEIINRVANSTKADFEATGVFNDDNAGISKLSVQTRQNYYAWSDAANSKYIIAEYVIKNTGTATINNLYAGIYADWDIDESDKNTAKYDEKNQLGYVYSLIGDNYYCGISLLNRTDARYYAADNDGDFGSVSINNGFTSAEKWTVLRTQRTEAGVSSIHPNGNDVSNSMSSGPVILPANDSIVIAFAIIGSTSYNDMVNSAINASNKYNHTSIASYNTKSTSTIYPNPANNSVTVYNANALIQDVKVFNVFGQIVIDYPCNSNHLQSIDVSKLTSGVYYIKTNNEIASSPFIKQ